MSLRGILRGAPLLLCAAALLTTTLFAAASFGADGRRFTEREAREFLLSEDFFDAYYGSNTDLLLDFKTGPNTVSAPFADEPKLWRAYLDLPFKTDCSRYSTFELVAETDNPEAIGSATLYFHSGAGWYNLSGTSKRLPNGRLEVLYQPKNAYVEGSPAGFENVDLVRFAFYHGTDANATIRLKSLKAVRSSFAVLDGYESEDASFITSTASVFNRCGVPCERLDVSKVSAETLSGYRAVVVAIGGKIPDEVVDALCDYIDAGGFVFAFYNMPEKLMKKLGVNANGFVSCRSKGVVLDGMELSRELVSSGAANGFSLPEFVAQQSWNFYKVVVNPEYEAPQASAITGDRKAHVLATWRHSEESESSEAYPSLVLSGAGLYCSHVFMSEGLEARKGLLSAIAAAVDSASVRVGAHQDWLSCFQVGVAPDTDVAAHRVKTLERMKRELSHRGVSLADAACFLREDSDLSDRASFIRFDGYVREIRQTLADEFCASQPSREHEGRLWWEHSGCGIWRGDWDRTMKALSEAGFNGVVPNMLWGGSAYYKSEVLPNAPVVEQYGDQIAQAVAAGKKYGVEVHAWMVCFNASNSTPEFLAQMRSEGRLQHTDSGEEKPWLCPSHPANRALQLAALEEVAFNYDVDGVHFDYIRYPDEHTCFCDGCRERFAAAYKASTGQTLEGDFVELVRKDAEIGAAWKLWREEQITALVKSVSDSLRARRPEIQISAAVFTGYPKTSGTIGQNWGEWIEKGYLDFVCPMDYTADPAVFKSYVEKQLPYAKGKCMFYPGIGMTATGIQMSGEEVALQAKLARDAGADGFIIFNLTESTAKAALPALKSGATSTRTDRPRKPAK